MSRRQPVEALSLPVRIRYVRAPEGHSFADGIEALREIARRVTPAHTATVHQAQTPEEAIPCPS